MAMHGARILFGTDTPSAPTYANQPGLNGWLEMQHMVDGKMTPLQVFRAATQTIDAYEGNRGVLQEIALRAAGFRNVSSDQAPAVELMNSST
jgi:imidazolonepropionase-like amidohydrolase